MNWYRYRLPGEAEAHGGSSDRLLSGLHTGFAFSPFKTRKDTIITIPADCDPDCKSDLKSEPGILPESTTRDQYKEEIVKIKEELTDETDKTVAARALTMSINVDINQLFENLCTAYPDAFVYAFSTPETGTWIGASPELLLRKEKDSVTTMALAGTREAGKEGDWDEKNIREQATVTKTIYDTLRRSCLYLIKDKTETRRAGTVEHLCTPMRGIIETRDNNILTLAALAPTPAVCGRDREKSMRLIAENERFDREMYGGFCGPVKGNGDFDLYVAIRSAKITPEGITLYAGGGITKASDPEKEWEETEQKLTTLLNQIRTNNQTHKYE